MKRVKISALVSDDMEKSSWEWSVKGIGEIESYEEKPIPKDDDLLAEYSVESLMDAVLQFANGLWSALKGLWKMSAWAVITIIEGLRWLWRKGWDSKDVREQAAKKNQKKH